MTLNRDAILCADDLKTREVEVPEWGGSVRVRAMTVGDQFAMSGDDKADKSRRLATFVARSCVDENGDRLFTDEDIPALEKKSPAALGRIWEAIAALNGFKEPEGN